MFYYTYLIYITDSKSSLYGHIYYGQHRTNDLLDEYICSSKILSKKWFKKHPNGYYRKILKLYNSSEELNKSEYDLIHPHLGKDYCLNLREGGHGGYVSAYIYKKIGKKISKTKKEKYANGEIIPWNKGIHFKPRISEEGRKRLGWNKGGKAWNSGLKNCFSDEWRIQQSARTKGEKNGFYGHKHTEEQRKKWSIIRKGCPRTSGSTNFKWMNNGIESKFVKPEDIDKYIKFGYSFGRIKKQIH